MNCTDRMCGADDCRTCHPELNWPKPALRTPHRIHLENKVDHIKGNWFLWSCRGEMTDGSEVEGSVQADGQGNLIAEETFEAD